MAALFTGTAKFFRRIALKRNDTTTLDPDDFLKVVDENDNILLRIEADGRIEMHNNAFDFYGTGGLSEWRIINGDSGAQLRIYNLGTGTFHWASFVNYFEIPGLRVKEGTNRQMGTAVLSAGTATVNTTAVTANSRIFVTNQALCGTAGFLRISARTAGTSFTITSSSGTDTSTVAWLLVEPTATV